MATANSYTTACFDAAQVLIREYSTSFWLASRSLPADMRRHIAALYALVRIADEIVDGALTEPRSPAAPPNPATAAPPSMAPTPATAPVPTAAALAAAQRAELDALEARVERAVAAGYSSDMIVHAFAQTARACAIGPDLWHPFFESMRTDITVRTHTPASLETYIYGSAQVVGLMCVRIFFAGPPAHRAADISAGARALGDAFQRVNFLRDYQYDRTVLGRTYLCDTSGADVGLTEARKQEEVVRIRTSLAVAKPAIELLPAPARGAVRAATALFSDLTERLAATPVAELTAARVRVPNTAKLFMSARAVLGGPL